MDDGALSFQKQVHAFIFEHEIIKNKHAIFSRKGRLYALLCAGIRSSLIIQ